jgi:hypothetical protein
VVGVWFVGGMVGVRVQIGCLEWSIEAQLGHCHCGWCFDFAVWVDWAAWMRDHVFAF